MIDPSIALLNDRYKIVKTLSGGMGIVYLCEDTSNNDFPVAIKAIKPDFFSDWDSRESFLKEVELWTNLGCHPNIVQSYGAEYQIDTHEILLVLQLIPIPAGKADPSLRAWLDSTDKLSEELSLRFAMDIVRGMKYATKIIPGLIHRDLKPENILVSIEELAMITDWGLAKVIDKTKNSLNETNLTGLSGTPLYMSPEQWLQEPLGYFTDIYSFGCILFECISGKPCVDGYTFEELATNHIIGAGLLNLNQSSFHPSLKNFLSKCLHPNSSNRLQNWMDVEISLLEVFHHLKIDYDERLEFIDVSRYSLIRKAEAYVAIAGAYLDIRKHDYRLFALLSHALDIARSQNSHRLLASCNGILGIVYAEIGKPDEAMSYYNKSLQIAQNINAGNLIVQNLGNIGNLYFQQGLFEKSIEFLEQAINIAKIQNQIIAESQYRKTLGNIYSLLGYIEKSLDQYNILIEFWSSRNNYLELCSILINLGTTYERLGRNDDALSFFERSLSVSTEIGELLSEIKARCGIAKVYVNQKRYQNAQSQLQTALKLGDRANDIYSRAEIFGDLAALFLLENNISKALDHAKIAIELGKQINNKQILARAYWTTGLSYELQKQYHDAVRNLRNATILFKEMGLPEYTQASEHLFLLRKKLGLI